MRKIFISVFVLAGFLFLFVSEIQSKRNGSPAARSGGAGESTCITSCHTGSALNSGGGTLTITSDAPGGVYTPGNTYTITVTMAQTGISRFGFEVLSAYSSASSSSVGTTTITSSTTTKIVTSGAKKYVTQLSAGSSGTNTKTWTYNWTAPNPGAGDVTFYVAANAANNNNSDSGDKIYTNSLLLAQEAVGVENELSQPWCGIAGSGSESQELILRNFPLGEMKMKVLDAKGSGVWADCIRVGGAEQHVSLPLQGFEAGVYFLQIQSGDFSKTLKWVLR